MTIFLIHTGEAKEPYFAEAFAEYRKRISAFAELSEFFVKPARTKGEKLTESETKLCLAKEGEAFSALLQTPKIARSFKIALCIEGKQLSSTELSRCFEEQLSGGKSSVTFLIGGSWGMAEKVKEACDMRLSFSKMTFPHSLFRVMLAEQIYRALSISAGGKYHK